ncbi:hypothetical protein LTR36_000725 [Oleoguttula mirabilis]|uniref:Uncharacterized protein n=1 Tax=Oleoguttula mirabilis TaxID=1507867 RepID=A0AAV9JTA0_9PEZI|nr:hypothetical protein LTR36_000725 [Oleoguttula mirabilis]
MSSSNSTVDYSGIRTRIFVPRFDGNPHHRRDAARFITLGYTVRDDYGRNLTIETRPDGTRRVVIGEDLLAAHNERIAQAAEAGALRTDASGRPFGLLPRPLTDYESGQEHDPVACKITGCDHPAHFDKDGKLRFEDLVGPKPKKDESKDNKGGKGGAAGAVAGGQTGGSTT